MSIPVVYYGILPFAWRKRKVHYTKPVPISCIMLKIWYFIFQQGKHKADNRCSLQCSQSQLQTVGRWWGARGLDRRRDESRSRFARVKSHSIIVVRRRKQLVGAYVVLDPFRVHGDVDIHTRQTWCRALHSPADDATDEPPVSVSFHRAQQRTSRVALLRNHMYTIIRYINHLYWLQEVRVACKSNRTRVQRRYCRFKGSYINLITNAYW